MGVCKVKNIIVITILSLCCNVYANNWSKIHSYTYDSSKEKNIFTQNGEKTDYADIKSFRRDQNKVTGWVLYDSKTPWGSPGLKFLSSKTKVLINCFHGTWQMLYTKRYLLPMGEGRVLSESDYMAMEPDRTFYYKNFIIHSEPGDVFDRRIRFICEKVR